MPAGSSGRVGSRVLKGGPSKLRGVIWHKSNGKWEARIYETGKQRFLGYFTSEVSAAKAYDARAVQLHGSAAKVNFPEDHYETRNNPPAVKPFCALSVPTPVKDDEPPNGKCRSTWTHVSIAGKRSNKRKDESKDEDYVLPSQSRSRRTSPQYSLRRHSGRRIIHDKSAAEDDGDSDSEESLEKGAVEVLATLLSTSDQDGSWRSSNGSGVRWTAFGDAHKVHRASSPPTASTGASPAPAQKQGVWAPPPLFVQNADAGSAESGQPMGTLQACAQMKFETVQGTEEFAESQFPSSHPATFEDNGGSSDSEQVSANLYGRTSSIAHPFECTESSRQTPQFIKAKRSLRYADQARALPPQPQAKCSPFQETAVIKDEQPWTAGSNINRVLSTAASSLVPRMEEQDTYRSREVGLQNCPSFKLGTPAGLGPKPRGSSRFRGVSWCEKGQKWRALLWDGNRQHFLGHFKSEEDGARAYDRALLIRKKKDGCLNFPLADYQNCAEHPSPQAPDSVKPKQAPDGGLDTGKIVGRLSDITNQQTHSHVKDCNIAKTSKGVSDKQSGQNRPFTAPKTPYQLGQQMTYNADDGNLASSIPQDGIAWCHQSKSWRACIRWGSQTYQLGYFDDKQAAAQAYNEAVLLRCGRPFHHMTDRYESAGTGYRAVAANVRSTDDKQTWRSSVPDLIAMDESVYQGYQGFPEGKNQLHAACSESPSCQYGAVKFPIKASFATDRPSAGWKSEERYSAYFNSNSSAIVTTGWGQKKRRCLSPASE